MFSRKWLQKASLQMKSMAIKKINWDLYSYLVKTFFLNPPVLVYHVFPFFELCSLQHRSFITFSVNIWKIEMSIFYTTAPSFFQFSGLSGFFLWSKFTCQFRKCVLSMCAKQAEKNDTAKTAQHSRVVQWGEHVSEGAFSKEFFLRHLRLCEHGKSSLIYRISHMNLSLTTYTGAEFVVTFSSRSRSLALKSSWKSHQMAPFFVQKEVLGENTDYGRPERK